jgi:hypothetical protein
MNDILWFDFPVRGVEQVDHPVGALWIFGIEQLGCGVALGVVVDYQYTFMFGSQYGGKVACNRGFTDAPLVVPNRDNHGTLRRLLLPSFLPQL